MKKTAFKRWSEAQERQLRALATNVPMEQLINELGRSRGAISAKAFSLRLSLDPRRSHNPDAAITRSKKHAKRMHLGTAARG
jgi:hypothetical protein